MSPDYFIQRLLRRPTCELAAHARLMWTARIRNARRETSAIRVAAHSIIRGELMVFGHGGQIDIGAWCYVGEGTRIWSAALVKVHDRVLISHNVNVFDSLTHPLSASARHEQFREITRSGHPRRIDLQERPVTIREDALIAAGAFILRGVTIGEGAVVGAGSVVTSDVPAYCIAAGNPARVIRELRADER